MSRFSQKYRKMKDSNVRRNICNSLIREEVTLSFNTNENFWGRKYSDDIYFTTLPFLGGERECETECVPSSKIEG